MSMNYDFDLYIEDLNEMANSAHDTCEESCDDCPNHDECMNSMRHSIGDLAQALAHTIELIKSLEHTVGDLATAITENLNMQVEEQDVKELRDNYFL